MASPTPWKMCPIERVSKCRMRQTISSEQHTCKQYSEKEVQAFISQQPSPDPNDALTYEEWAKQNSTIMERLRQVANGYPQRNSQLPQITPKELAFLETMVASQADAPITGENIAEDSTLPNRPCAHTSDSSRVLRSLVDKGILKHLGGKRGYVLAHTANKVGSEVSYYELGKVQQRLLAPFAEEGVYRLRTPDVAQAGLKQSDHSNVRKELRKLTDMGILIHYKPRGGYCAGSWPSDAPHRPWVESKELMEAGSTPEAQKELREKLAQRQARREAILNSKTPTPPPNLI